ncbi:MAG: 3-dehydroquinate synthase, partial [Candidatus Omnitrophica bacterium]|nr:3-dehydroquinate synthase [Candidatus Omnitrophota bacterium]
MRKAKVNLGKRTYSIIIGSGILSQLGVFLKKLDIGTGAFIITNKFLKNKYGSKLARVLSNSNFSFHFQVVADSEKSKSIQTAGNVIRNLSKFDKKKRIFIIAFGGGVIGDLSGFVASVYKRGTSYVQIPTTLLAQVDSSIGGKTALDLDLGKNLVGAIYQPRLVFSDIDFLMSLDKKQLSSGMAEVIKYAVIKDRRLFNYLEDKYKYIIEGNPNALEKIVASCSQIKAKITSSDEKEDLGQRTILNFGHTIGHAIETAGGYRKYNHGQAIGLGMIAAINLSVRLKLIDKKLSARIEDLIKLYGLPYRLKGVSIDKIIKAHYHDKKFSGKENKFVLVCGIGKTKIVRNISLDLIREAIKKL